MKPLSKDQLDLIERFGVHHAKQGHRPAAGRIIGLLLVSPDRELTFDQIRETLALSKSATSTALTFLQAAGSVEYITRPGDRKRYFRKRIDDWEKRFFEKGVRFFDIRALLAEAARGHDPESESAQALDRFQGFLAVLEEALIEAYSDWSSDQDES